jgi:hypothetical protein
MSSQKIEQSNNLRNMKKLDEIVTRNTITSQGTDEDNTLDEKVTTPASIKVEH